MSSDSEFLMRMGEARHRLERLYYDDTPWTDFNTQNPFWDVNRENGSKLDLIRRTLLSRHEELFEILLLMNPVKDK